jgi:hypothetical protein
MREKDGDTEAGEDEDVGSNQRMKARVEDAKHEGNSLVRGRGVCEDLLHEEAGLPAVPLQSKCRGKSFDAKGAKFKDKVRNG